MLEARDISFEWRGKKVLSGASLSVNPGEIVAVTGENGCGKTTLLKILAGIWLPRSGAVCVDGADIFLAPLRHRKRIGWLGETAPAEEDMPVKAYLKYRARLKGESKRKIRHRVQEALSSCCLEHAADTPSGKLSRGTRKRVALAEAALLRPRFLILDDLFAGLDAAARESAAELVKSFSAFASVVVSGHELDMFRAMGARIAELKDGRFA